MARQQHKQELSAVPEPADDGADLEKDWPENESPQEIETEAALAIGLDDVPLIPDEDELTPETLLGGHRDGRWATREDESDLGLDELPEERAGDEEDEEV